MNAMIICGLLMGMLSATYCDLRYNRVPNFIFLFLIIFRIVIGVFNDYGQLMISASLTVVVIVISLLIYYAFKEKIGAGDFKIVIMLAFYLDIFAFLNTIIITMSTILIFCIITLLGKRLTRKSTIPLVPFFTIATIIQIIIQNF